MLFLFGFLLFLVGVFVVLLLPALWGWKIYDQYGGSRAVECPETRRQVAVRFAALRAAYTGLMGRPHLHLADCTRWPERAHCGQECMPDALRTGPYREGEVHLAREKKRIYHLPVLMAGFAAWAFGVIWHSQYLFREPFRNALGVTRAELWEIVHPRAPHLLSLAALVLFAYGVAWLLAISKCKGVRRGIAAGFILWAALALASTFTTGLSGLSESLVKIELGYTLLATVLIGATVGGLSGRLVEQTFEASPTAGI